MNKKCIGCGAVLQYIYPSIEGYVKKDVYDKSKYCERCFKIKHYGKLDVLEIKKDFLSMMRDIRNTRAGIIYLIDILSLSNINNEYIKLLEQNDIVILTKKDLLPKSVKDKKIIKYFKEHFITKANVMVISSVKKYNIDLLFKELDKFPKTYYVVGQTNSGKSTFINALVNSLGRKGNITTSVLPNTTTEYIKIKINDKLNIIDTPGFIEKKSIYNYITIDKIKEIVPKKEIKPKVMQTKSGFTVIVSDLLRIDNIGKEKANLIFYMNNNMNFIKVKITTKDDLKSLPKKNIKTDGNTDIVINGLGFIKVTTKSTLVVYTLDEDIISTRSKMI